MGKLVDSDWLRAQWDEPTDWKNGDQVLHHYTWYKTMIDVAPTVDAVPVVRCKGCKYWRDTDHTCREHSLVSPMTAEDFCSKGERKDGEQHD